MSRYQQKGTSTVEFAMMLPLLLLLVVMVSEFGMMFCSLNAVSKSVQVAARYLADTSSGNGYTAANETIAKNLAVYGSPVNTGTPILPGFATDNILVSDLGQEVRVTASYNASLILGTSLNALMQIFGGSAATDFMTLNASSVMRFSQ